MGTNYQDAAPVAISGNVGSTVTLLDLLKQAYGDNVNQIQSVFVGQNAVFGSYWDPADPHATTISSTGTINFADFANVKITIGNNINSNIFVTLPENSNWDAMRTLSVNVLPQKLDANLPGGSRPDRGRYRLDRQDDRERRARRANSNDCHNIACDIAASAGATLDANTGNTGRKPGRERGRWLLARRLSRHRAARRRLADQVQAGDIVRMSVGTQRRESHRHRHRRPQRRIHPGQIRSSTTANGVISEHWPT